MRASTAYFVGAGTIVAAIAIGLGGGIVAGNIMNPVTPKQGPDTSKMERRAEAVTPGKTTVAANALSERVQYLTGSQAFGALIAAPAQAQAEAKPDPQAVQANAEPPAPATAVEPPKPAEVVKPAEQQVSTAPSASPDNAYAKARDSDLKRAASERRRLERRARWAERRHDESRGLRDRADWDDIARNVREDSDARDLTRRPPGGAPRIMLFGSDDD